MRCWTDLVQLGRAKRNIHPNLEKYPHLKLKIMPCGADLAQRGRVRRNIQPNLANILCAKISYLTFHTWMLPAQRLIYLLGVGIL